MKYAATSRPPVLILALIAALATFATAALAQQSGTWTNLLGGSWATAANWTNNLIASGSGNTANFGTLTLTAAPTVTLDGAQTIGSLLFNDVGNTYGWTLNTGSGGPLTLAASSGAPVITVSNQTTTVGLVLAGSGGLIKRGPGALVLTGANTYTGTTTVSNGVVTYSGSGASSGAGTLVVGGANGSGVFNMNSSGTVSFTTGTPTIGGNGGSTDTGVGALNQTSGTLNLAASGAYLTLGDSGSSSAYGSLNLSGGTLTITSGGGMRIGSGGLGSFVQSGGTFSCGRYFVVGGNYGTSSADTGVATLTGGSATVNSSYYVIIGNLSGSKGVLNLGTEAGGNATLTSASGTGLYVGQVSGATGTLNLDSGTVVISGPILSASGAANTLNLNGGTIQAGANNLTLINTTITNVNVYNGGVTINDSTDTNTISASLINAAGNGIYPSGGSFAISSGGGSGYIGAPLVTVSGGSGSGALAIATVSGGVVTGVTMTCPGKNYVAGDNLSFAFAGGGATTAASTFTHTLASGDIAANATGGLTKNGAGQLTLSAASTYSGSTLVNAGTLNVTADGGMGYGNVAVANGATLVLSGGSTNGYVASTANLVAGSTSVVNLNYSGTDTIYSLSTNGGNTFVTPGVYGAVGSGATYTIANFTGLGTLTVLSLPSLSVALSSSANPSVTRQPVTFTGTVSGNSGTPTGTLTFKNGTNVLGTVTLNGSGAATLTTNFLVVSNYSITATYSGNGSYPAFTSPILTQVVNGGNDIWSGAVSAVWDINATTNWTQSSVPVTYWDSDTVQFDDTATGPTAVVLNTTVSPSGMFFNNSAKNYSVGGSGTIAGTGGLLMMGSGTVTLSTSNSYTGTTLVSNGVVTYTGVEARRPCVWTRASMCARIRDADSRRWVFGASGSRSGFELQCTQRNGQPRDVTRGSVRPSIGKAHAGRARGRARRSRGSGRRGEVDEVPRGRAAARRASRDWPPPGGCRGAPRPRARRRRARGASTSAS